MLVFPGVYVCVKAKLTLIRFFFNFFFAPFPNYCQFFFCSVTFLIQAKARPWVKVWQQGGFVSKNQTWSMGNLGLLQVNCGERDCERYASDLLHELLSVKVWLWLVLNLLSRSSVTVCSASLCPFDIFHHPGLIWLEKEITWVPPFLR